MRCIVALEYVHHIPTSRAEIGFKDKACTMAYLPGTQSIQNIEIALRFLDVCPDFRARLLRLLYNRCILARQLVQVRQRVLPIKIPPYDDFDFLILKIWLLKQIHHLFHLLLPKNHPDHRGPEVQLNNQHGYIVERVVRLIERTQTTIIVYIVNKNQGLRFIIPLQLPVFRITSSQSMSLSSYENLVLFKV
jgi:hypothetical protein